MVHAILVLEANRRALIFDLAMAIATTGRSSDDVRVVGRRVAQLKKALAVIRREELGAMIRKAR